MTIVDLFDITTGKAIYGQDVRLPGNALSPSLARPPVVQGKVASYDASGHHEGARRREGGQDRVGTPPPAVYSAARWCRGGGGTWAAMKGRDALKITWDDGPNASFEFGRL